MLADKTIIYIKQTDVPIIPVTARIEWLSDGKIKPIMYWTPDNACYEIKHIYESTVLAFLKERGKGIRFKIKAELIEQSEHDSQITLHETYLYFADNRYCEKGFIDERYGHSKKEYIPVALDIFPDGDYELVWFWVGDNRYMVEKTLAVEPRGSFHAGGIGVCHKVEARLVKADDDEDPDPQISIRRLAALYRELNKWFVAVNVA